ncbi:MAG: class I tRNA ligase family protein, partial [Hyphomonadaceae bacterium]|nr:class I tRNA ligase family protein [Clostridia bacterium]
ESIMISKFPEFDEQLVFETEEKQMELIKSAIKSVRNLRAEMNVVPSKRAKLMLITDLKDIFQKGTQFFQKLAGASDVLFIDKQSIPQNAVSVVIEGAEIYIPLDDLIDRAKEIERLQKEQQNLQGEIDRVDKKLSNEGFVAKAPAKVIDEEKAKKQKYQEMLVKVSERLDALE